MCRPFERVGLCDTGIQRPAGASQLSRMNSGAGAGQLTDTMSAAAATRRLGVAISLATKASRLPPPKEDWTALVVGKGEDWVCPTR